MIYTFGSFRLDADRFELSRDGVPVTVEPQALELILLLIRHRGRLVPKEEIVAAIWGGRAISDASLSSRVHAARLALGDDGATQAAIRTVHGRGFRFVAQLDEANSPAAAQNPAPEAALDSPEHAGRPAIVVPPLRPLGAGPEVGLMADALSHDVIQALSRMRWLTVIARGTAFQFRTQDAGMATICERIGARYALTGVLEADGNRLSATLELTAYPDGAVIWGDRLSVTAGAVEELRARIVAHVVAALELYLPTREAMAARLGSTENLDAWASYHLALHHMYRFNREDNARATILFEQAAHRDPAFARAHAGLSFTRFQDAFLRYGADIGSAAADARRHAERGLEIDPLDPFVNFTMGRTFWLNGDPDAAIAWLDRATTLNPNYAQGFYSRAFSRMLIGQGAHVDTDIEGALRLSPLDPLRYGMLGVRSLALIQAGLFDAAADWGEQAAIAPGAHFLIAMIALVANSLAGREARAIHWRADVLRRRPRASRQHFFAAFPIRDETARGLIAKTFDRHGL